MIKLSFFIYLPVKSLIRASFIFLASMIYTCFPCCTLTTAIAGTKPAQKARMVTRTLAGQIDMCLSCHPERPDRAHGRRVMGCFSCHLGNPLAGTPEEAHRGMVLNPGDLRVAQKTCGQEGCHVEQVKHVKNTLMATNRGIISTLQYYWGEIQDNNGTLTVDKLLENHHDKKGLAADYFRKLCGTCHLWLPRNTLPGFLSEKGGGCTACHYLPKKMESGRPKDKHPLITRQIPMKNCVRCHNRSGRIGLSYQGLYETEGYGVPFEDGEFSSLQLGDGRFVHKIHPDIHYEKGLVCIDCHNQKELMGDGKQRTHLYQQVEIRCETCHSGQDGLERLLQEQNSNKKYPLLNNLIRSEDKQILLKGKLDNKPHPLRPFSRDKCRNPQHSRLSCQACHSSWVPQCYGCHVRYDRGKTQLDKLSLKETFGRWQEYRSYMRYENPTLGMLQGNNEKPGEIVILVPG